MTLESTPGGKWVDDLKLFDGGVKGVNDKDALSIWSRVSERYSQNSSGVAVGILNNPWEGSIFNKIEFPALKLNPNVSNVITGGK